MFWSIQKYLFSCPLCLFRPFLIHSSRYTTNTIEGFHRQVRKVTKTKGAFSSDMALMKLIYLTTQNIAEKRTMPAANWSLTLSQLSIIFGERLRLHLQVSPSGLAA